MKQALKKLGIIIILLLAGSGVARAGTTQIRAVIEPVRIIVLDDQDEITEIYSNTPEDITPVVRRDTSEGAIIDLHDSVQKEYRELLPSLPTQTRGKIYEAPTVRKTSSVLNWISRLF